MISDPLSRPATESPSHAALRRRLWDRAANWTLPGWTEECGDRVLVNGKHAGWAQVTHWNFTPAKCGT